MADAINLGKSAADILRRPSHGKAAENKRHKREELLNSAFDLFTQKGIANTSISNIVEKAGVAKGTFYLYFKDKYDIRDRLIRHKAFQILDKAWDALNKTGIKTLEDEIVFLADHIVGQLSEDKMTLRFISKNLSWGLLRHEMATTAPDPADTDHGEMNLEDRFEAAFDASPVKYKNPEVMLYMVIEFVGSTCYSSILYNDPLPIDQLRPYIDDAVRALMHSQEICQEIPARTGKAAEPVGA